MNNKNLVDDLLKPIDISVKVDENIGSLCNLENFNVKDKQVSQEKKDTIFSTNENRNREIQNIMRIGDTKNKSAFVKSDNGSSGASSNIVDKINNAISIPKEKVVDKFVPCANRNRTMYVVIFIVCVFVAFCALVYYLRNSNKRNTYDYMPNDEYDEL